MYFLYSLLLTLGVIALLPRFAYDALRHGKYVTGLRERLGSLGPIQADGRPIIWLHSVSVGETQAARPLVRALLDRYPTHSLVVSTTTVTGQQVARELFGPEAAAVFYFPFDWAWTVRRSLDRINPSAVLIMETELWPNFLRECGRRQIPVAVVNGRLSERSFGRYKLVRSFIRRVINHLSLALMQSEADANRLRDLGIEAARAVVSGNVKFDVGVNSDERALTNQLRARFQITEERPLIVAASTHSPEEQILLESFGQLLRAAGTSRPRLLIAPRHPERFAEVSALLKASGLKWAQRSSEPGPLDAESDLILLDTIGELRAVYPLAALVFVGGSLAPVGGHNVLEPAAAGAPVITGPHTFNFTAIVRDFLDAQALVQLPSLPEAELSTALAATFSELLADDERRLKIVERARATLEQNRGATMRTVALLGPLLGPSPDCAAGEQTQGARARRALSS